MARVPGSAPARLSASAAGRPPASRAAWRRSLLPGPARAPRHRPAACEAPQRCSGHLGRQTRRRCRDLRRPAAASALPRCPRRQASPWRGPQGEPRLAIPLPRPAATLRPRPPPQPSQPRPPPRPFAPAKEPQTAAAWSPGGRGACRRRCGGRPLRPAAWRQLRRLRLAPRRQAASSEAGRPRETPTRSPTRECAWRDAPWPRLPPARAAARGPIA
mmetsp:Transcript_11862/g.46334  ORF Transcript_11862/g.46334 Transcript_11862/m.46334 type:complete len:216 (+) Transcript_11862:182-829(+)